MHFGHPRSITTFKNRNFLKNWVFQGFPHTRLGHFGLFFGLKVSKPLQKMAKEWWKNEKNSEIFQKYSKLPPITFWDPWTHHKTPQIAIFENFMNFDSQNRLFWSIFSWNLPLTYLYMPKSLGKIFKKITKKFFLVKNILKLPKKNFGTPRTSQTSNIQ